MWDSKNLRWQLLSIILWIAEQLQSTGLSDRMSKLTSSHNSTAASPPSPSSISFTPFFLHLVRDCIRVLARTFVLAYFTLIENHLNRVVGSPNYHIQIFALEC